MQTFTFTEGRHAAEFVLSEANVHRSRDNLLLAASQNIVAGTILAAAVIAAGVSALSSADAGNAADTGTLTLDGATPVLDGAQDGTYHIVCIEPAAGAGTFEVFDPKGVAVGKAMAGATFANQIKFAIAAGATDFKAGEGFSIKVGVEAGDLKYSAMANTGPGGAKLAIALYNVVTAAGETSTQTSAITRDAELAGPRLTWPNGISAAAKAEAINALAAQGIIVR
jgi:hypothetical protein